MKQYKASFYNNIFKKERNYYVYNSLNGLKAKIYDATLINQIDKLENGEVLEEKDIDKQLVESGIAVESHLDEVKIAHEIINVSLVNNNTKLRLIILPTRECNFRCKYCYEDKRKEFMSEETIKNLIDATINHLSENKSIKELHIEWFGGEPMLCYDIILKISRALKAFCDERSINYVMTMTTNGYLLNKKIVEELLNYN